MRLAGSVAFLGIMLASAVPASGQSLQGPAGQSSAVDAADVQNEVRRSSPDGQSEAVTRLLLWIAESGDNQGIPFIVLDKLNAQIFVFDADGRSLGTAPALIGIARGDDAAPGVGNRSLASIPVEQRTTPAGRFIAKFGPARGHPPVLWIDYANAISLHPVVTANKKEHRLQRIKSASTEDHRISFGCINVPAQFYAEVVKSLFSDRKSKAVAYILPDTKPLTEVFPTMGLLTSRGSMGGTGQPQ